MGFQESSLISEVCFILRVIEVVLDKLRLALFKITFEINFA